MTERKGFRKLKPKPKRVKPKVRLKPKPKRVGMSESEVQYKVLEFRRLKEEKKEIEKREKELRDELEAYIEQNLEKEANGSALYSTLDEEGNKVSLQRRINKRISLDEERAVALLSQIPEGENIVEEEEVVSKEVTQDQILEILQEHAPEYLERKQVVNEDLLKEAVTNGDISIDEFEKMCNIKETVVVAFVKEEE